jgi:hypothetical protein
VNRVFVHAPQTRPPGMAAAPTYVMVYPPPLALSFATLAVSRETVRRHSLHGTALTARLWSSRSASRRASTLG